MDWEKTHIVTSPATHVLFSCPDTTTNQANQKENIQTFKVFYTRGVDPLYEQMEKFLENKIHSQPTCDKGEIILKAN